MNQNISPEKSFSKQSGSPKQIDLKHLLPVLGLLLLLIILLFSMKKGTDGRIALPLSSKDCAGSDYEDVLGSFQDAGFTNIETKAIEDLVLGWITKDGEIEEVEVDGHTTFSANSKYLPEVKIIITYHTFPPKKEPVSDPPTKPTEPEKAPASQPEETSQPSSASGEASSQVEPEPDPEIEGSLTIENCPALLAMLAAKGENDPCYAEFAETYRGKTIEFDGCIVSIANHENYKTRYDLLVQGGDFVDPNTANLGPYFSLRNVAGTSISSFGDSIRIGSNVHIVAEVVDYNSNNFWFTLSPKEIVER